MAAGTADLLRATLDMLILTSLGRRRLGEEKQNWAHAVAAITKVMETG